MDSMLTKGAIKTMLTDGREVDNAVLQVLNIKVVNTAPQPRYRMVLSDGEYSTASCMLGSQYNEMVNTELTVYSVFTVIKYIVNVASTGKKIIIILNLDIVKPGQEIGRTIGNPELYEKLMLSNSNETNERSSSTFQNKKPSLPSTISSSGMSENCHPIESLSPYQNKWTICARVTNKSDIRTWSNSKGQGKLFSMDLLDESGEIRATAFNDQCDKFYDMIEVGKVYFISQAQLKAANKQFCSLKNDYEMTFTSASKVSMCHDVDKFPSMKFEFVSINQIADIDRETLIDVIGVCKDASQMSTVTQKSTGKELKKREIQIIDETKTEVRLTLWGTQAEKFEGMGNPVIAVKGVKVSDFNGKSLSCLASSKFVLNPDIRECHKLRAWFQNFDKHSETNNISGDRGTNISAPFITISEAIAQNLGCGEAASFYIVKGFPTLIKKDNCMYIACPSDNCNKKVIDLNNGLYRCEKCNHEYDSFNWRFLLNLQISDGTESVWATIFQLEAETLLQTTATDLARIKEESEDDFIKVFNDGNFKEFFFTLRVKRETYNDEPRMRTTVASVRQYDPKEYNRHLLSKIKKMIGQTN